MPTDTDTTARRRLRGFGAVLGVELPADLTGSTFVALDAVRVHHERACAARDRHLADPTDHGSLQRWQYELELVEQRLVSAWPRVGDDLTVPALRRALVADHLAAAAAWQAALPTRPHMAVRAAYDTLDTLDTVAVRHALDMRAVTYDVGERLCDMWGVVDDPAILRELLSDVDGVRPTGDQLTDVLGQLDRRLTRPADAEQDDPQLLLVDVGQVAGLHATLCLFDLRHRTADDALLVLDGRSTAARAAGVNLPLAGKLGIERLDGVDGRLVCDDTVLATAAGLIHAGGVYREAGGSVRALEDAAALVRSAC